MLDVFFFKLRVSWEFCESNGPTLDSQIERMPLTIIPRVAMRWPPGGKGARGRPKET